MKKQTGAALIITILLISILASIAFATSRLGISEIKQSSQLEDSEIAYQAAEGGIEMGLLLFRYNKSVEVPSGVSGGMDESTMQCLRYNITDNMFVDSPNCTIPPKERNKEFFDLRIWHKNSDRTESGQTYDANVENVTAKACTKAQFESNLCVDDNNGYCQGGHEGVSFEKCYLNTNNNKYQIFPAIIQDGVAEYDVSNINTGYVSITWRYLNSPSITESDKYRFLYIPKDNNGNILKNDPPKEYGMNEYLYNYSYSANANGSGITSTLLGGLVDKIRIKPFGGSLLNYKITSSDATKMDSRYTYIESTGYLGSAKRKLKISIDRATGSMLSPYDFLLYSDQN
jgi:Tfp pilus assembly protein PilX